MKVAAIVVTYNRKILLKENIQALMEQTQKNALDIIIIDNASSDGTGEMLRPMSEAGEIIYINPGANLGGAGGFQYGIRYATEHGYDFLWVMDDDCIPNENALEEFLKWDKKLDNHYGFLSSRVLWKDGSICTMNVQRETLTKNVRDFTSEIIQISMASFVSLFLPTSVIREIGLPIKEFFIWTDDWEYTRRISRKYPSYLINSSTVVHKSASNIGANIATDVPERLDRFNYLYRNDVFLYRREGVKGFCYEVVRLSAHVLKTVLRAKDNKGKRVGIILKATIDGLSFKPDIEYVGDSHD